MTSTLLIQVVLRDFPSDKLRNYVQTIQTLNVPYRNAQINFENSLTRNLQ